MNMFRKTDDANQAGFQRDSQIGFYVSDQLHSDLKRAREIEQIVRELHPKPNPSALAKAPTPHGHADSKSWYAKSGAAVQIFDPEALERILRTRDEHDSDRTKRQRGDLEAGCAHSGLRQLPDKLLEEIVVGLGTLKVDMPNFAEVIDMLVAEMALAMSGQAEDFWVSAICINGVPGIGKSRFAREVARILDVGFEAVSMGASAGFELAGVPAGYTNSSAGRIWRLLADGDSACPVVLLDEVDKMGSDERYPTLPTVLDLLEVDSARSFRDEALEARFDASKLIVLLTANDIDAIPAPLQSRVQMIEIQQPTQEQRREIAGRIATEFTSVGVSFDRPVLDAVCELDVDLRALRRFLRQAAGQALSEQKKNVGLSDVSIPAKPVERRVGFL